MSSNAAAALIGHPWTPETNCWWLVREYFARCRGIALPDLAGLGRGVRATGWRPVVCGSHGADDIILMRGPSGARHVGVMLAADARLAVLHCDGGLCTTPRGTTAPWGGVVWQPLADLAASGYRDFEFWRAPC